MELSRGPPMQRPTTNTYFGMLIPMENGCHLPLMGGAVTIGRSSQLCDLVIEGKTVSRLHCVITHEHSGVFLEDLSSLNGTWVDSATIERTRLRDGQVVHIGSEACIVKLNRTSQNN